MSKTPPAESGIGPPVFQTSPISQATTAAVESQQHQLTVHRSEFVGPLPPPDVLERYNKIQNGFADRIIRMAEEEGAHRRSLEEVKLKADIAAREGAIAIDRMTIGGTLHIQRRGQMFAFAIGVTAIIGGVYCAVNGTELAGGLIGGGGVIGLVWVFIAGNKRVEPPGGNNAVTGISQEPGPK